MTNERWRACAGALLCVLAVSVLPFGSPAQTQLKVIISGGFNAAYRAVLPDFEKSSGIMVTTTMGFSQGAGDTIAKQLQRGVPADVVILAKEGLADIPPDKIAPGTSVDLAQTPTGVSVRAGAPKPDISTVDAFKQMLHNAKLVAIPPSTVGIYVSTKLYPQLGMADEMSTKTTRDNSALTRGEADVAIRAVSELLDMRNADYVGTIPKEIQFISVFSAAITADAKDPAAAKQLIAFLTSNQAAATIRKSGMEPMGKN